METHSRKRTAFTLVELLTVVGIITLLIGILLPVLSKAQIAARELRSLSGLRQMMLGYTMYYQDNKGAILFGYPPSKVNGVTVSADDPLSGQTFGFPVASRYPWRLLPYVGNIWQIIHSHDDIPTMPSPGETAAQAFLDAYNLSLNPTYGINSTYVGGDASYAGFVGASNAPNVGHHVVFKDTDVLSPTTLIVFADCQMWNASSMGKGLYSLTPPYASGHNWQVTNGTIETLNPNILTGIPQGWYSKRVMVAFFDGHAEAMYPAQLDDMRLWANSATTADYDYAP